MKTLKKTLILVLMASISTTFSCTKEGKEGAQGPMGQTGPAGPSGPDARTFNFTLTFNTGDTFKSYSGITGFDANDVILFYVHYETLSSTYYWAPLPMIAGNMNIIPEFSESSGFVFINTLKADGTSGSPWTSSSTLAFKAVLVKSSLLIANPGITSKNYEEVKRILNLKD
jgi:hypothetical protein